MYHHLLSTPHDCLVPLDHQWTSAYRRKQNKVMVFRTHQSGAHQDAHVYAIWQLQTHCCLLWWLKYNITGNLRTENVNSLFSTVYAL